MKVILIIFIFVILVSGCNSSHINNESVVSDDTSNDKKQVCTEEELYTFCREGSVWKKIVREDCYMQDILKENCSGECVFDKERVIGECVG